MLTIEEKKKRRAEYMKEYHKKNKAALTEYKKEYYQKNKEALAEHRKNNKEAIYERRKEHRKNNKEALAKYAREWSKKNKGRRAEYSRKWEENNKEARAKYYKEYRKNRYNTNLDFKIGTILRGALYKNLKRHLIKETNPEFSYTKTSSSLLGCTVEELKTHIENQFKDGMTWENWKYDGWHLDHIIPCSSFDLTKKKEHKKCFHYTNLQPLWAKDNLSKSNKLNWSREELVA
tara:strand:- start:219 stop:917 length:699 start_codon:yes stop_codon:yes gene_type:complete